ncbi:MAG: transcription-repair coupling factor [Pseudomonadota bacterium]
MSQNTVFAAPPSAARRWGQLHGAATPLAVAEHVARASCLTVVLIPGAAELLRLESALRWFLPNSLPLRVIPDWETLPYDPFSPHQDIVSQRIEALYHLPQQRDGALLLPVQTLLQRLAPPSFIRGHALLLSRGERLDPDALRRDLVEAGYRAVSQVLEHGEFARRGSLLDLFPMGATTPYRLDFFDDEIDSIKLFDPETQIATDSVDRVQLLPAHEFPLNESGITRFRTQFRERFEHYGGSPIYRDVTSGIAPSGIEYYQPLFFDGMATLRDYLPDDVAMLMLEGCDQALEAHWAQIADRYEQMRHDIERPLLPPETVFVDLDNARELIADCEPIEVGSFESQDSAAHNFGTQLPSRFPVNPRHDEPLHLLQSHLGSKPGRVLFTAESPGRREALNDLLRGNGITPQAVDSWSAFLQSELRDAITVAPTGEGLQLASGEIAVIDESQLYGERARSSERSRRDRRRSEALIANLADLAIGSPVVHIDHGVGRYRGLTTFDIGDVQTEYLTLEYADDNKLYVPVANLHLIGRYTGADESSAPLHKLGSDQWAKVKRKAAEKARDVAAELLDVHARRAARQGRAVPVDTGNYTQFSSGFPFEETEDQGRAIEDTLRDLERAQPMDRVVCGDVGFGKTEVAMRAAFAAADAGLQVAVLVPTTLLAQQHTKNFQDRFADWPIRIAGLSRFGSSKAHADTLAELRAGTVDIVIGTHKLLSKEVQFKNLGLVIIDEEHRFGVRHKEYLKSLRAEVDVLTLTATPIPRTLNMSLSGLRDLSIIATAPAHRHAIKTFVTQWNDQIVREACQRELARGGQVYVLHNEVRTIDKVAREIAELVPEATVQYAHGQMRETELESVMLDFYHQRFSILVCTTIVESGIDVPTANTIIINRADKLGLAQLHQLRGRVGRSHHRAYAYLITPHPKAMTEDAQKRLAAIESLEDLGVGFTLATHDLEIRGAGELLGEGQSGQIQQVGFTLYSELLERAVAALKAGKIPDVDTPLGGNTEVDLHTPALLPEDYVPDVHTRLILYKRLASAGNLDDITELQVELINRFGLLPDQTKALIAQTEFKLRCDALGATKLDAGAAGGRLRFQSTPNFDPLCLIDLVQKQPQVYSFEGQHALRFTADLQDRETRLAFVDALLTTLETSP